MDCERSPQPLPRRGSQAVPMRTQSFTSYAAARGLSLPKLLAFYRRGLVPEFVGRVANPPISVAAWSAKNGISRRTGLALYREEKCPRGAILGQRFPRHRWPWWMSHEADNPVARELRRLARQRQRRTAESSLNQLTDMPMKTNIESDWEALLIEMRRARSRYASDSIA